MPDVQIPYRPRAIQREIHRALRRHRFACLVLHRRAGKTVMLIVHLILSALAHRLERPRFAYVAPFRSQAKQIAWDYLLHYTAAIPGRAVNETELRVDLPNGARVQLYGADNPDALRGLYFDGVALDEYGQMRRSLLAEVVRPALADRQGWLVVSGTPKGKNAFHDIYETAASDPAWYARVARASETGIVDAEELEAARRMMSPEQYEQEFECSWSAGIPGAYYARILEDMEREAPPRIGRVPWEPVLPVHTGWDLGIGDSTAIWFAQVHGREVRLIDYHEDDGVGLAEYFALLRSKPYTYGVHLWPHDGAVRELGTGKSREEMAQAAGVSVSIQPAQRVEDGIEAVRNMLRRAWIDAEKCKLGLDAVKSYRREYDDRHNVFKDRPLHDWSSHGADALRTLAMGLPEHTAAKARPKPQTRWVV